MINTKKYYRKYSEDKDFSLDMTKGLTNITFAELTVTMLSNNIDSYKRSYKKFPQLLSEIGGIANSLYIIVLFLNFYVEKKSKEIDIFNECCRECKEEHVRNINRDKDKEIKSLRKKIVDNRNGFVNCMDKKDKDHKNNETHIDDINYMQTPNVLDLLSEEGSPRKLIKKDDFEKKEIINEKSPKILIKKNTNNSMVRFKSIIFKEDISLDILINVNYSFFEIIFPCKRRLIQVEKMKIAEVFCDELFDIHFLFGNILDFQIISRNNQDFKI